MWESHALIYISEKRLKMVKKYFCCDRQMGRRAMDRVTIPWDESFIWGVMTYRALKEAGLSFRLVSARDIRTGALLNCAVLLVPGGWSSNKIKALGDTGAARIRQFVNEGGTYTGFCGGAGMATLQGLALLDVERVSTDRRVPSFNGRIRLILKNCALWEDIQDPLFYAWWPS